MKQEKKQKTIGLDLGEKRHRFCVLDGKGEVIEEGRLNNDRGSLAGDWLEVTQGRWW